MKLKLIALIATSLITTSSFAGYKILDEHTTYSNGATGGFQHISEESHSLKKNTSNNTAETSASIKAKTTYIMLLTSIPADFSLEINNDTGREMFEIEYKLSISDGKIMDKVIHVQVDKDSSYKTNDYAFLNVNYDSPQSLTTRAEIWVKGARGELLSNSKAMSTLTVNSRQ